jgi:hypothetical protein
MISKSFNNEKFVQSIRENVDNFYNTNNIIEKFIDVNSNTTWDFKRAKVETLLNNHFTKTEIENITHLRKLTDAKNIFGSKEIEDISDYLKGRLNNIRNAYSTGTPGVNSKDMYGIIYTITNFFPFSDFIRNLDDEIYVYVEYSDIAINANNHNFKSKNPLMKIDFTNMQNYYFHEMVFDSKMNKYMNILFYFRNNIICSYLLDIKKLDLMRPYKLKLESNNQAYKSEIELGIFKWTNEKISDDDSQLYNYFFGQPNYLYDNNVENVIEGLDKNNNQLENLKKIISVENDELLKEISKNLNGFLFEEFKKNTLSICNKIKGSDEKVNQAIQSFVTTVFEKEGTQTIFSEWFKNTESSFEEILYAACLVDPSTLTIYEKLKLIFDVAKMRNYIIYNDDKLDVKKLKELVYSLYKRFMVYFNRADVERLVDYILSKENTNNIKHALLYSDKDSDTVNYILNDKDSIVAKSIKDILKIGESNNITNINKNMAAITNILINNFNYCKLNPNIISSVLDILMGNAKSKTPCNKLLIDICNETTRRIKTLDIIDGSVHDPDGDKFVYSYEGNLTSTYEKIIGKELNSFEMHNNQNTEITFEKFKELFFELPFIPDLLRATCCFNNSVNEKFIKSFNCVKVEISAYAGNVKSFIFSRNRVFNFNLGKS